MARLYSIETGMATEEMVARNIRRDLRSRLEIRSSMNPEASITEELVSQVPVTRGWQGRGVTFIYFLSWQFLK